MGVICPVEVMYCWSSGEWRVLLKSCWCVVVVVVVVIVVVVVVIVDGADSTN